VALDLSRDECPRRDSEARTEIIEHAEAGENLTQAHVEEIVDKAMIVSPQAAWSESPSRERGGGITTGVSP
jgi:hypothetical protein